MDCELLFISLLMYTHYFLIMATTNQWFIKETSYKFKCLDSIRRIASKIQIFEIYE